MTDRKSLSLMPKERRPVAWRIRLKSGNQMDWSYYTTTPPLVKQSEWDIEPLYNHPQPAPSAFDPEAVAAAIRKQVESWKGSHSQSNQMVALRDTANAIADCLPADEREGWLRKCGVNNV